MNTFDPNAFSEDENLSVLVAEASTLRIPPGQEPPTTFMVGNIAYRFAHHAFNAHKDFIAWVYNSTGGEGIELHILND